MKNIKDETGKEMDEMKQSIVNSYSNFEQDLKAWKANAQSKFDDIQTQVSQSWHHQLQ